MVATEEPGVGAHLNEAANASAQKRETRARNRRTGLILATVALVFFIGVILRHTLFR